VFQLDNPQKSLVYAHKSLLLFRSIEREITVDLNEEMTIRTMMKMKQIPEFFRLVHSSKKG